MNDYNIYSQGTFTFYSNPNDDEDGSKMASVSASRTGLERIVLDYGTARRLHHLGIFGGKKNEARNPKLDTILCAATLGLVF